MPTQMTPREQTAQQAAKPFTGRRVHMIGMGGCGMRAVAEMLLGCGAVVSGSDRAGSAALDRLIDRGATVAVGQRDENIPDGCELVVYSAAIHPQNPERLAAERRGIEVVKYSEMLGRLMDRHVGLAVAGTHGKSTTAAMVAYAMHAAGATPSYIIGATVGQLGGPCGVGTGRHFVAEACEFDRSFLHLRPRLATILNIEEDHLDCYDDLDAIVEAFGAFAGQVDDAGVLVVNGESRHAVRAAEGARAAVETFGLADGCDWQAADVQHRRGRYAFELRYGGQRFAQVGLSLAGRHNVYNALAAAALLHQAGLSPQAIADGLGGFTGAHRRMTVKGAPRGVTVVDDYAHHPTEIQVTLRALRERYEPRRLVCVFQPHQHSRTRFLLKDFARSFTCAEKVFVPEIYFVRDSAREKEYISSQDLVAQIRLNGGAAEYLESFEQIVERLLAEVSAGDLLVTMGAGNVWEVADELVRGLGRDHNVR
ncbi:MAG: UDP-N-acetylmuramate--L-alanine ligase [Phycisphaerae bacterium]|nr:UDP-N-acetylmuramate--L-alanine ligase [Phycisphaerae bacterium]